MATLKLAVLISGGGTNLQALIDACSNPAYPAEIVLVISNEPQAYGLERARQAGIPTHIAHHREYDSRPAFDDALHKVLSAQPIDLICLAGFMRILGGAFTQKWDGKIINTHPSLLPKFGGKGMYGQHVHRAVLDAGETETGSTVHFVTEGVDQGPIILQKTVPVMPDDTPDTLAARVLAEEHKAYPQAVRLIAEGQIQYQKP